ncbi:MAG: hypothetical protein QF415_07370 [Candidatus Undinarchaeales archaeon]|nr:hypothetical protein [Candidatus Undinarchaeales archaeon]MDP7492945.1 hypothetical protein [Candidatus Undinarchaeales archaeon]
MRRTALVLALALLLVGCTDQGPSDEGGATPSLSSSPEPTPPPTVGPVLATASPSPEGTPVPTPVLSAPPISTSTPVPTALPTTTPTSVPTPTPTTAPTPTPRPTIEFDRRAPPAVTIINAGETVRGVKLISREHILEVIVPPPLTATAPFDSAILPDGSVVMAGNEGLLVSVGPEGAISETRIPGGMNFEPADDGTMWYYNWVDGEVSFWKEGIDGGPEVAASLPPVYTDGSIAVSPDGSAVYVAWWKLDYDVKKESALYRYTEDEGLVKLLDGTDGSVLRAVEVTQDGTVYVAATDGIYRLEGDNELALVHRILYNHVTSDGLTSDEEGNLYFSALGWGMGVFKLSDDGSAETIATFSEDVDVPLGLSWDQNNGRVIGVRKEKGELISIDGDGDVSVLNDPSGLSTPIAIREHPEGGVFLNADEAGPMYIDGSGDVVRYPTFGARPVYYQPPAADIVFDEAGLMYYTCAAPGFMSKIVTIDAYGEVRDITGSSEHEASSPAGIAVDSRGRVFYADYRQGAVLELSADGESTPVLEGIPYPVGLVIDSHDTFWVSAAPEGSQATDNPLDEVDRTRVLRFRPGEELEEVFNFGDDDRHSFTFFDVDDEGTIYLPDDNILWRVSPDGEATELATGFRNIRAARIFKDSSVYLVDYEAGALYRLRRA